MKIFRPEHFGGILFDTDTFKYSFINKDIQPEQPRADRILKTTLPSRTDIISAPIRIYFELLRYCNLHCKGCFADASKKHPRKPLLTKTVTDMIDEFADAGVFDLRFTGGEPTQRDDWFDILRHAKLRGFAVSLNTNGVYDELDDTVQKLASLDLEQVTLSIDGTRQHHDFWRGRGTYDRTIEAVKRLYAAGVKLRFNTVINKNNVGDIPAIIEVASKYTREVNFFYERPVGRALDHPEYALSFEEHFNSARETIALREKYPSLNILHFEQSFTERSILKDANIPQALLPALPYGNTTLNIASDGSFWPYGYNIYQDDRFKLGTWPQDHLVPIWTASKRLDTLRVWFRTLLERCNGCDEYFKRCAGINYETELAKMKGEIAHNPFCNNPSPIPDIRESL
jgi:MoaA/NifB/PqqE/SkfB family radical SAM enzyme